MKFKETEPTLYVYAPNRTTLYGCTPLPNKLSINYRFNTFSEMSFEIRKYYYDERKEEWVKNSLYDKIEKNNLIKMMMLDDELHEIEKKEIFKLGFKEALIILNKMGLLNLKKE